MYLLVFALILFYRDASWVTQFWSFHLLGKSRSENLNRELNRFSIALNRSLR